MTDKQLAYEIAKGLIATGVEGGYGAVTCSTAGDYPSLGASQWEGLGGRGDMLLSYIDGGSQFAGRSYSDIESNGELDALAALLDSPQGQIAQNMILADDCLQKYIPALQAVPDLANPACIIYAGIWCPTSHHVVNKFLTRRQERDYDINDLETIRDLFRDQYATAADCEEYAEGYANRANNTYNYVSSLDLEGLQC
ncbi:hypothetical protein SPSIL_015290 [Sporomusa silvacetica DSM 10669]|uniref:Peptidoglycan binding domain protein n=1 Tax=Sporomusa silvacetica DSM 10669 TaxID=1123289 RepID=A0ABZ3IIC4_9FIRM|nr:hypothetical protein [Sporomusa silvacetica]OZC21591.1 hypothetical protein SPSIL_10020 [Sporomusa silvacetica DSM 10669]